MIKTFKLWSIGYLFSILLSLVFVVLSHSAEIYDTKNNPHSELARVQTFYYPSGKIMIRAQFKNMIPNGLWQEFWPNGNLRRKGYYTNGREQGLWRVMNADGIVIVEGSYLHGKKNGPHHYYNNEGVLQETILHR